ncbi:hypothetical protein UFOVP257_280 [uncultured Caudovirales phage]|uniref:Uncharacterized protein n=1 Tax=uncultured Caudovirales phage TaxID=2100421 RepID=A0A6J5LFT7_9CAUD|nr:hypothetical protein UFOVP257_280 [uncultured Caudovirales phage]
MTKKYYQKIDLDLSDIDMSRIIGGALQEGYVDTFRSYNLLDDDYFTYCWMRRINFKIPPQKVNYTEITGTGAPPHTDPTIAVLNYYVNSANCVTMFWEPKGTSLNKQIIEEIYSDGNLNTSQSALYGKEELVIADKFLAESHSAYVIRTDIVHSVAKPELNTTRQLFRFLWMNMSMEEMIENLEIIKR